MIVLLYLLLLQTTLFFRADVSFLTFVHSLCKYKANVRSLFNDDNKYANKPYYGFVRLQVNYNCLLAFPSYDFTLLKPEIMNYKGNTTLEFSYSSKYLH